MTPSLSRILEETKQLSVLERIELTDFLVENLAHNIPPNIAQAQITEVRRRIVQVEAGEVELVPGDEALEQVHRLVVSFRTA